MLTVTVNDRPIDVAAIIEQGHVLLPMRATFSALGAQIRYDPRGQIVVARSALHAVRLQLDSRVARVDGKAVELEVAPRIVATRIYVPLRFVAQAMGALVGYDARANLVSITSAASNAVGAVQSGAKIFALSPAAQSVIPTAYPTISASLGAANAARDDVTLTVDGEDVTQLASFDGSTITYMPRIGLERGAHTVVFAGRTSQNEAFSASWSFDTSLQAPADVPALPAYNYQFYANGSQAYYPGDWMRFTLIAPPGGSAELQLCGLGFLYPLWNGGYGSVYQAAFPAPSGYWLPSCAVDAIYTSWSGQQYVVPIPIFVGLYTAPHGRHSPTPAPSSHPATRLPQPRRAEPTPAPAATPKPPPIATPKPPPVATQAPAPIPIRTAAPRPVMPKPAPPPRPQTVPVPHPRRTP